MCGHRADASGSLLYPRIATEVIALPRFSAQCQNQTPGHSQLNMASIRANTNSKLRPHSQPLANRSQKVERNSETEVKKERLYWGLRADRAEHYA
jgi:hypothetical protein